MAGSKSKSKKSGGGARESEKPQASDQDSNEVKGKPDNFESTRETIESIVVAFILAFLFRAFVAEAFVIPTGSMAPTLMGAHKDVFCEHCGQQYQASASSEYDSNTGALLPFKTIASACSNCRGINGYDFSSNPNHATFSGDRILVSKFDYVLSSPERWDVFVFKYPLAARMNYIKRLIGLPGETIRISEGDIYVKPAGGTAFEIAHKPPDKIQAMKRVVNSTLHRPQELVEGGWPSSWQPLRTSEGLDDQWTVSNDAQQWSAQLASSASPQWLRYYHKHPSLADWEDRLEGTEIPIVDAYKTQLITDYLAYNTSYVMTDAKQLFDLKQSGLTRLIPGPFRPSPKYVPNEEKTDGQRVLDAARQSPLVRFKVMPESNSGDHWVGDLTAEFEVEVESDSGSLMVDLVEFGIHFTCSFDVSTGVATLTAHDGDQTLGIFDGDSSLQADTDLQGRGTYTVEIANVDDQIVLWVNRQVVDFGRPSTYELSGVRDGSARRPYWSEDDPLDAAPAGIGGNGLACKLNHAKVFRDIYYIAVQPGGAFCDFPKNRSTLLEALPADAEVGAFTSSMDLISTIYSTPQWWASTNLFSKRRPREYELEEGQYLPLGDNSAASSDARANEWAGHRYVEEKYLLGKALLVFWPHTWNSPVPFTPNVKRMGLIR